jgi:hypothetical protein
MVLPQLLFTSVINVKEVMSNKTMEVEVDNTTDREVSDMEQPSPYTEDLKAILGKFCKCND